VRIAEGVGVDYNLVLFEVLKRGVNYYLFFVESLQNSLYFHSYYLYN